MRSGAVPVVARFGLAVPDVVEDLRERREILLGHALSLAVLVLTAALLLLPGREAQGDAPRALDAYEQAMERLRDRGLAQSREHEAERVRLEERLARSAPMARAGELTAGMAHEVRNGLGTILGYARLLERDVPREDATAAARAIREECEALETVVRRFVDFVKDEALHLAPFDITRTLSRVAARESRRRSGAAAVVGSGESVLFSGDEEMLERAFENLVRNGLEAAGSGGHVFVQVSEGDGSVEVRIEDDGPGLSLEARRALRPFLTTKPGGLGLGLPIVYKIVGLHGGEIRMGDRPPRGLAVTVRLPRPASDVTEGSVGGPSSAAEEKR
jgi:signal transduction histidine kinase